MTPKSRSVSGGLMTLIIIPVIIGLLACMPVPIGNPERSRIDPELSGLWTMQDSDGDIMGIVLFEPYDKRTWLGFMVQPGLYERNAPHEFDIYTLEGLIAALNDESSESPLVVADELAVYKIWLTKLGGEQFMVWQPKGAFHEGKFDTEYGLNWHLTKHGETSFDLSGIRSNHPAIKDVDDKNRKALEKAIRKHASEPELYDEDAWTFKKVDPEHADKLGGLIIDNLGME